MIGEVDYIAVQISNHNRQSSCLVSAATYRRVIHNLIDLGSNNLEGVQGCNSPIYSHHIIELYEFTDNGQLSCLDALLNQSGENLVLILSNEWEDKAKGFGRKLANILTSKHLTCVYAKKSDFVKKTDTVELLRRIVSSQSQAASLMSIVEIERPHAINSLECIFSTVKIRNGGKFDVVVELKLGYLDTFMRLDSAAAEAVNLLPKADHPSQYGSLFGVLNRCRTSMGSRLLDRWLRQPLLDVAEINRRLDVVQVMFTHPAYRNKLRDGPLKSVPDLDTVISKVSKKNAGLGELYRLYLFAQSIPILCAILDELRSACEGDRNLPHTLSETLKNRFIFPLKAIEQKFSGFERLVEHVLDFDQLPELKVNPKHDPELQGLAEEQAQLETDAEKILQRARDGWASSADVKMETNTSTNAKSTLQHFLLRTIRADERQLKASHSSVEIVSILKTGVYFTVPALRTISDRYATIQEEYREQQQELVVKALETAATYTPLLECVAHLIAELDVLVSFSTSAALSPGVYVRPTLLQKGSGVLQLEQARHPCVELMDGVNFIPNDYDLVRGTSGFQIVTGPNMGGKSTYIRAVGTIVVMAQVGMFVPCKSATVSVVDCILARVGAGDAVQKGVSTFMAEMLESSTILQSATQDSLIIIDELGRGTSTFDGFGLAWAISDFISSRVRCFCLFATHFHELTALAASTDSNAVVVDDAKGVVNKHVAAAIVESDEVVMLHQVRDGPCLQSYGIHIAKTAGFPAGVIREAKRKASELEGNTSTTHDHNISAENSKFTRMKAAIEEFKALDVPTLSTENLLKTPTVQRLKEVDL